jgi:hypothetical protein
MNRWGRLIIRILIVPGVPGCLPHSVENVSGPECELRGDCAGREVGRSETSPKRWWKGNLHTHSLWSDGQDYPEMVARWYKMAGYNFVALSDHDVFAWGRTWISVNASRGGRAAFDAYLSTFGRDWVSSEGSGDSLMVELRPLVEYRGLFEEPDQFLLLPSEEISDQLDSRPLHLNALNIHEVIAPQGGRTAADVIRRNLAAVREQRSRVGRPVLAYLNHPFFRSGLQFNDLRSVDDLSLIEIYSGHPLVNAVSDSSEQLWDRLLADRVARGVAPLYGVAVDDAHDYFGDVGMGRRPGRGWVMVSASELTPTSIVAALEQGSFYASTGVELDEITSEQGVIRIAIKPRTGVSYITQFVGSLRSDVSSGSRTGLVLSETQGTEAVYLCLGDELYVRARVVSSAPKMDPPRPGEPEMAWTQPVACPTRRAAAHGLVRPTSRLAGRDR